MAHSHESSPTLCQIQTPAGHGWLDLLKVAVSSDTGKNHLEDYKLGKEVFLALSLPCCTDGFISAQLVYIQPLNEVPVRIMHRSSVLSTFYSFGTSYSLRGSPCQS